jgi:hypothetical protein
MRSFQLIALVALAGHPVWPADGPDTRTAKLPPVLRPTEPFDSVMVTLPGARPKPVMIVQPAEPVHPAPEKTSNPVPPPLTATAPPVAPVPPKAPAVETKMPAVDLKKSFLPPDLEKEAAVFCQRLIGQWTEEDAEQLLGKPLRQRSSYDEKNGVNGRIYAFADPSGRYRELELDFDQGAGTLRTVFAYPKGMTWQDCRRRWNGEVSEADARQGRTFYSYLNRRLDVLVDAKGRVISLGLY